MRRDRIVKEEKQFADNLDEYEKERERDIRKMKREMDDMDGETEVVLGSVNSVVAVTDKFIRKERSPDKQRDKRWWTDGYRNWDDHMFKKTLRIKKGTFDEILSEIFEKLWKEPTVMKPNPTTPEAQLAITLYRLAHGCSLTTLEDLFGESISNCSNIFNNVCRVFVSTLYDRDVKLPENDEQWASELKGFIDLNPSKSKHIWKFPHLLFLHMSDISSAGEENCKNPPFRRGKEGE